MPHHAAIAPGDFGWICRHGHEAPLLEELARRGVAARLGPMPGLCVGTAAAPVDPVWALQELPFLNILRGGSVRALADAVADALRDAIDDGEPAWAWHWLLPATLRGNPRPPMQRRLELVAEAATARLQATRRRALRRRVEPAPGVQPDLLVQVLLLEPETLALSVARPVALDVGGSWPSSLPAGHAVVPDDPAAPASSYRKLEEGFALLQVWPQPGERAVDLGASPGGWTRVLRRYGATVTAVDRAPLADPLMADPGVEVVLGDAFRYQPSDGLDWLVSDIVAYPERIVALLGELGRLAPRRGVVQMKFQGAVDWEAIDAGLAAAAGQGYAARARHVFNDKNEVTIVVRRLAEGA